MSLELIATIICDTCGLRAPSEPGRKFTEANWIAGKHRNELEKAGWIVVDRGRYHLQAHVCPGCADKPLPKLPGKPRFKGPDLTPQIEDALQPVCLLQEGTTVWVLLKGDARLSLAKPCMMMQFRIDEDVFVRWSVKGRRKTFGKEMIEGWIFHRALCELLGFRVPVT